MTRTKISMDLPTVLYQKLKLYAAARNIPVGTLVTRYLDAEVRKLEEVFNFDSALEKLNECNE